MSPARLLLLTVLVGSVSCLATTLPARAAPEAAPAAAADRAALPSDPDQLLAFVTDALRDHDEGAFERLVNWEGVRPPRKRLTLYQIRTTFGRPVKAMTVEDFPADGLAEAEARGTYKINMPVTKRLRVVFDEDAGEPDAESANVFLLGQKDGVYRIAVLNSVGPPRGK
ncbi:hypothetical protein MKK50_14640 [Methylobacterium sp. J-043]|uniref:hypothetical protein n=1 Tax=Methylorubrum TaxID=2282523 RepID=UPI00209E15B1|nr:MULTISPECIES: hypothetical protein [Methylorubrum]MCJ2030622.1 hypothetical protein [Methylobacterium sp. J-043]MCP1550308.1 hypothetical protein [Methylorubrum zatmanii]MCP1553079.1 hypothetical protein [Methylorubrum extorquens]MCP1580611.1 hypothetical protein [Methylorubrum extorquens]